MTNVSFYCINFKDDNRRTNMINRWNKLDLILNFVDPVEQDDSRLNVPYIQDRRTASIMLQHIDSMKHFLDNSTNEYCIICEDDIFVSKNLKENLPEFINTYEKLSLDVLLLGYLVSYEIEPWNTYYNTKLITDKYQYKTFPNDLWGTQMYLFSRKHAKHMIETYQLDFIFKNPDIPYNPDWIITKLGNNLIAYPMIAVEEGITKTDHYGQNEVHSKTFTVNFKPDVHF
jgi:GR25 family glycosyltransferase involved in LPS biosynthesis